MLLKESLPLTLNQSRMYNIQCECLVKCCKNTFNKRLGSKRYLSKTLFRELIYVSA